MRARMVSVAALLLASCDQSQPMQNSNYRLLIPSQTQNAPAPPKPPAPHPRMNPKSPQAAEELVRQFAALLNAGKLDDAYALVGQGAPPRDQFIEAFAQYGALNVRAGASGGQEGAAGSIYMKVPLIVSGQLDGKPVIRRADAVLRRINDVPGSTEAQRRWHIERIDWADTGSLAGGSG